ncbi:hypothetical protein C4D60_Mb01t12430 [Musa balbisiana]|uniref:Uncharacterized protein n=1 Tax=Musa balbisiana TaxID=52838 RepID=A0A4S8JML1_MUSBA|nr:hypothetical protein C4D60_Mb01t12430 [Musa balbisiana]
MWELKGGAKEPWPRGRRGSVRVRMTEDLPGGFLGTAEVAGLGRFDRGGGSSFPPERGSSPMHSVRGASSSFLHIGRVGVLDPTPPTIKSVKGCRGFVSVLFPPPFRM